MGKGKTKTPVFAIVRVDNFQDSAVPIAERIAIVKVVLDRELANEEQARLQQLQGAAGVDATYAVIPTRLVVESGVSDNAGY